MTSNYIAQAGLQLVTFLPQPAECWEAVYHHAWLLDFYPQKIYLRVCLYTYFCEFLVIGVYVRLGYPRTRVISTCELLSGCWEVNQGPLQEQLVLLAIEPLSLRPPSILNSI